MLEATLLRIVERLDSAGIPYMVIGGFAVTAHGVTRMTQDIDVTLGVDISEFDRVMEAVQMDFDILGENPRGFAEKTNVLLLRDRESGVRLDLVFSFIPFERRAIANADRITIAGGSINVVRVEDLMIYKMLAGRDRDIEDVRNLFVSNQGNIDCEYIDKELQRIAEILESDAYSKWQSIREEQQE